MRERVFRVRGLPSYSKADPHLNQGGSSYLSQEPPSLVGQVLRIYSTYG